MELRDLIKQQKQQLVDSKDNARMKVEKFIKNHKTLVRNRKKCIVVYGSKEKLQSSREVREEELSLAQDLGKTVLEGVKIIKRILRSYMG